jgi:hypothetical protein
MANVTTEPLITEQPADEDRYMLTGLVNLACDFAICGSMRSLILKGKSQYESRDGLESLDLNRFRK